MKLTLASEFLQSLGWTLLHSVWQMALLWLVYLIINQLANLSSRQKHSLAAGLVFLSFAWNIFTFLYIHLWTDANTFSTVGLATFFSQNVAKQASIFSIVAVVYLFFLCFQFIQFGRKYFLVKKLRSVNLSKVPIEWKLFTQRVSGYLQIKRPVQIWFSERIASPATIGFFKPIILLPAAILSNLSTSQVEAIILHELTHIKRNDYLINLFIQFISSIYYFNPFIKLIIREIEKEREFSCDENVLNFAYNNHDYASALLVLEKEKQASLFSLAANGTEKDLLERVQTILAVHPQKRRTFFHFTQPIMVVIALVCFHSIFKTTSNNTSAKMNVSAINPPSSNYIYPQMHDFSNILDKSNSLFYSSDNISQTEKNNKPRKSITGEKEWANVDFTIDSPLYVVKNVLNNPFATFASQLENTLDAELSLEEIAQVKEAVAGAKNVVKEIQWAEVEKSLAEVFTQTQKEKIKAEYNHVFNSYDLAKWESNLSYAYEDLNWNEINKKIATSLHTIRLDSVQVAYNKALVEMNKAMSEMQKLSLSAIPDSDITLEKLTAKKEEVKAALKEIEAAKKKKVVDL